MPNVNDLGESKHLKTGDFPNPVVVTITGYDKQNVAKENETPAMKYVLNLKGVSKQLPLNKDGQEKPMTLNKTNGNRIAKILGTGDFDGWIGKQVEVYHDPMVEFKGEIVGGLRIRPVPPQGRSMEGLPTMEQEQQSQPPVGQDTRDHSDGDPDFP